MLALNLRALTVLAMLAVAAALIVQTAFAENQEETRPGWGFGDENHVHIGPPGLSVNP